MNEPPRRTYKTKSGRILTDVDFEKLASEAAEGYDVADLPRRPGRPLIGAAPAVVVPVRLHADLLAATKELAVAEDTSLSELVRDALSHYLSTDASLGAFRSASGRVFSEAEFDALADEAEQLSDATPVGRKLKRQSGVRAEVVPVRMPPELKEAVERRAETEETSVSELVREALRARIGGDQPDPGGGATSRPVRGPGSQGGRSRTGRGHTGPSTGSVMGRSHRLGPRKRDTCRDYVVPRLKQAGWGDEQIVEQYPVTDGRIISIGSKHRRADPLRADYVLEYRPGLPVAVVEAKREYSIPGKGMQQAKNYAQLLDLPFAYATNGKGIVEDDADTGRETEHLDTFPSPDELWLRYRAFKGLDAQLAADGVALPFNRSLRNFDGSVKEPRYYQRTAINRAVAAILRGDKRLLLTLATGTGKTFVSMQIVWKLWSSAWHPGRHPRVLYLADRNILIDQPRLDYFVPAFGDGPVWTLRGRPKSGREIYFALYQAIADSGGEDDGIFRNYSPDYFDLVIVDECHRGSASAESAWRRILEHFSPATQLGMTAAPKRDETADSYEYFGNPLYEYSLAQGIEDGFLAPYRVRRVVLSADAHGWSPTEGQLDLFGREIPDGLYTTSQFERVVSLLSRTEAAARHLTDYLKHTDRWAKTIVFCVDQEHAHQMRQALHNANSDLTRQHPDYVVRIVSDEGEIGAGHLGSFADTESDTPVIATTSQLLSTGVDLPTVKNIVLFRPVGSMAMFKQMIGRGTRLFPDADKLSFDILDYSGATALFADPEFDGPPERVDREEIDETGAVVDDVVVEQPEPPFESGEQSEDGIDESEVEPRAKFYVGETEVWVTAEAMYHLDPATHRLRLVEYREYVADAVRTIFPEPSELRARWRTRVGRREVRGALVARGIDIDELAERTGLIDADPLDILVHLAWNQPLATRRDRTRRIRKEHADFFDAHQPAAREVLSQLLEKYAEYGIDQLDDLGVLEVPPISALGSPAEIAGRFGSPAALREAVEELGELLYVA
jgi:type I restriction enzyme R subunit